MKRDVEQRCAGRKSFAHGEEQYILGEDFTVGSWIGVLLLSHEVRRIGLEGVN